MTDRLTVDTITSDQLDALCDQLDALRAGEEPGYVEHAMPTPGQWIWVWNRALPAERLRIVQAFLDDAATANLCRFSGHVQRLEEDRVAWVRLARVREVIATMGEITGARHWASILSKAANGEEPTPVPAATRPGPVATVEGNPAAAEAIRQLDADPHGLEAGMIVKPYREHGEERWVFRCWGTDTCDGRLSLDHSSEQGAQRARDRHVTEAHDKEQ